MSAWGHRSLLAQGCPRRASRDRHGPNRSFLGLEGVAAVHRNPLRPHRQVRPAMAWAWNPYAIPGLVVPVLVAGMAWAVYSVRPRQSQNRVLAVYMSTLALGVLAGHGLRFL